MFTIFTLRQGDTNELTFWEIDET